MSEVSRSTLEGRFREAWPPPNWCDSNVVLAVSAGPDSVALLRLTLAIKSASGGNGAVFVAHFNHSVRKEAADADQAWLEDLCRRFEVPCFTGSADPAMISLKGDGWEATARAARYDFLRQTAEQVGARLVAVAHTANDQVETILHRILRGTGVEGLAGIPRHRPLSSSVTLVRPLLEFRRSDLLAYLAELGQVFRVDETNRDVRWTRNRLRHELLPVLREQYNPAIDDALLRLAAQAGDVQQIVAHLARQAGEECISVDHPADSEAGFVRVCIECGPLTGRPQHLVREVCRLAWQQANWPLQAMGFEAWQQLAELVLGRRREALNLPHNVRARRKERAVVLEKIE